MDRGCLSWIPDPDFYPSRIPYPRSQISDSGSKSSNKREGWKKISCHSFHLTNWKLFHFWIAEEKNIGPRIIELFAQKIVTKLSKIWVWDPGSRQHLFWISDPGVNYELLNHSNFNTCYWSSNYSDCWHPDLPSNRSWGMVLKCTVEMGNIEQVFNFTVKLKIVTDVL